MQKRKECCLLNRKRRLEILKKTASANDELEFAFWKITFDLFDLADGDTLDLFQDYFEIQYQYIRRSILRDVSCEKRWSNIAA